jgi:rod shape-determining protein MreC
LAGQYDYSTAKWLNSVDRFRNYFTLNKGTKQGVEKKVKVVNGYGLSGEIKIVSNNFSVGLLGPYTQNYLFLR